MVHWEDCVQALLFYRAAGFRAFLLFCCVLAASALTRPMELRQTRYEVRAGEPAEVSAPSETLDFLSAAKTRRVEVAGAAAEGIVVAPNRAGKMVVAASLRAKPGEYAVTISAASATGEERQAAATVLVKPRVTVPNGSTRNPVVLLNGWETGFTNSCPISLNSSDTFGNLAQYLVADGVPVVYFFDNCLEDANQAVETLGNDLGAFLKTIQYDDGTQVPQIDLVGFSLGGLIARSYLAGLQPDQSLTPPSPTLVGKLVLLATPNFGSFIAGSYVNSIAAGTQSAELMPGSAFLWNLANWNQRTDDLRGVSAISVIGNAGSYTPVLGSSTFLTNASDGLVSLTSASGGFVTQKPSITRIVPYCHVDPSAFTNPVFGTFMCNSGGIANVTSSSHLTGQIVRSFLSGTSDWTSIGTSPAADPYLSQNGGMFFALVNSGGAYAGDVTQVAWGNLQLTNGGNINTIFYTDFVSGTGNIQVSSASLGTLNCGSYAQTFGYFSAVRCKVNASIFSIGPLLTTSPLVVTSGGPITIRGAAFSGQCIDCKVTATPVGSAAAQILQINSWTNTAITAVLPASLTGFMTITVYAVTGVDNLAVMAATASPSTIAVNPASLQFSYTAGDDVPASQSIQIANSGAGSLAWTATASASWLSVTPASGTDASTLTVSVSPSGLDAGTYTGNIQIASTGASNTPVSVPVTFTVTAAPPVLAVSPQSLSFTYSTGAAPPAAQTVSIANTGGGALSWTATTTDYWLALSATSGSAPGTLSISINPANLAPGTYTTQVQIAAAGATGSPSSIAVTLVVEGTQAAPNITAVANAASYQPGFASATWLSIFGTNLSSATYSWQNSDFVNGLLPTSLEGVSVTVNGKPAFVDYISPTQINVLAPDDTATGMVQVQVTTARQASNSFGVSKTQFAPAFFTIDNGAYAAALHSDYTLVGSANLLPGVTTRPAQPGETIQIYGAGFGPTNPALPTSQVVTTPAVLANTVQVTIGGVNATVTYAGLVESGTYQLNVTVPSLPTGDAAVVATIGGVTTQTGVSVTVQQ